MPTVVSTATMRETEWDESGAPIAWGSGQERRFRPDIQALRALAVLLVVVYHLWPGTLRGGFVGVDVFFVISGFLVTAHLVDSTARAGRVRVGQFWARRAFRLLPASLFTIGLTTLGVLLWVPQNRWSEQLQQALASTFYVQNWVLADQASGYREVADQPSALQHFWSLAVEEQFYVALPLVLLVVWVVTRRRWRGTFVVVLAVITVVSFIWSVVYTVQRPEQAYFVTTTRAWELGLGALLGLVGTQRLRRVPPVLAWVGLLAIVAAAVLYTGDLPFPGWIALLPVAGALLVLATLRHDGTFDAIAGSWPVQRIGDASYSIYLWHWPLVVLVPEALGRPTTTPERLVLLAASLLAGWASLRWIERPWRASPGQILRWRDPTVGFIALVTAVAVMITVSGFGVLRDDRQEAKAEVAALKVDARCFGGASLRSDCVTPDVVVPALSLLDREDAIEEPCFSRPGSDRLNICSYGPRTGAELRVAAVGDSHMAVLSPVYRYLAERYDWRIDVMGKAACYPLDVRFPGPSHEANGCAAWGRAAQARVQDGGYDAVITLHSEQRKALAGTQRIAFNRTTSSLVRSWQGITASGARLLAIEDFPFFDESVYACTETDDVAALLRCGVSRTSAYSGGNTQRSAVSRVPGSTLVPTSDLFCRGDRCPMAIGGVRVYFNRIHITTTYGQTIAPILAARIRDAALAQR